jgi:hypothetical protein
VKEESVKEEEEKEHEDDEYSDSDSEEEEQEKPGKCGKRGCRKRGCRGGCEGGCVFIRECDDASKSSVVSSLGGSSDDRSCPSDFQRLACDRKRKCIELVSPCKKKCEEKHEKEHEEEHEEELEEEHEGESNLGKESESSEKSEKKESPAAPTAPAAPAAPVAEKSSSGSGKGKKFVVTWGAKAGHPWEEYNGSDAPSIHINGKNGPVLHLYRGGTYFFCVEQEIAEGANPAHRLVLTNSPAGGVGSRIIPGSFEPVGKGCVSFKVEDTTPRYFFYQDLDVTFAGGLVIVHDKE